MQALECDNRTGILSTALEEFLHFAEQKDIAALDLFELVKRIDQEGAGPAFSTQA